MINVLAIGAVVGGVVGIVAYVPQVLHLIRVKDSKGISLIAWFSWLFGNVLLLMYAISIKSVPYIIDEILFCLANITIIILAIKYKIKND